MTTGHRYQWEQMLDRAAYSFLDYHWPRDWADERWDDVLKDFIERLEGGFADAWHDTRAAQEQNWADAGHRDTEEAMAEAEARVER